MEHAIIREAKIEDIPELEKIFLITRQETFKEKMSDKFKLEDYQKSVEGEEVWVAEKNDIIVGFISLWLPDNFIHNLFIHPAWQGYGIGKQLLKKAEDRLFRPMELKVTLDNFRACQFYQKQGWSKIAVYEDLSEPYILFRK